MYLENDTLRLRALEPEDLDILYKWENDTSLWWVSCTTEPYSRYILKEYIAYSDKTIYEKKQLRLMIVRKEDNAVVGTIDLTDFDPHNMRAGIGLLIDANYRNHGYAQLALDILLDYAFGFLHLHQLYAYVPKTNESTMHLFEKANFQCNGVLKEWIRRGDAYVDVAVWQYMK